ncbi:ferredoxin [Algoriphagus limi]|uniref:Ferredoxin n=1 Tax=Algoriphagus limi TaxID=2975273 RepID=A0ABT2G6V5_9BACT|nr:ferredoxin [Algoriphagus limi]MCS5491015.1 ferredoxin [Algoriphagus limi]
MKEELKNNTMVDHQPLIWEKSDPVPEAEMQAFWKKLRHFYRTCILPKDGKRMHVTSALLDYLDEGEASSYPFTIAEKNGMSRSINLNSNTPFQFLDYLVSKHHVSNRKSFTSQLSELITGLNKLLQIEDSQAEQESLKNTFDFADELIAFDKMVNLLPKNQKAELSEKRLQRLTEVISTLQKGLNHYKEKESVVVLEKSWKEAISKEKLFKNSQIVETNNDAFNETLELFSKEVKSFVELIRAFRIASLEIKDEFKEEIHEEYFDHFTWYRLSQEELNLFHPVILIVDKGYLFDHLTSFSKLLASNRPIKVLVLNQELITTPDKDLAWEDASRQYKQEIATLGIAHRNVSVFQSGMDEPELILEGIHDCLKSTSPSICYLSLPDEKELEGNTPSLIMKAENASRYFPKISYNPTQRSVSGKRFQLSKNIQASKAWPTFSLSAKGSDGLTKIEAAFTYADYKAIFPEKAEELMFIPSRYYTEHLVSISEYLELEESKLYGKIPFIWVKDETGHLLRAAVPNVWVVSCQERLDFWNQLRELAGIPEVAIGGESTPMDQVKIGAEPGVSSETDRQELLKSLQEEAISVAAQRLISVLLDDEEFKFNEAALTEERPLKEESPAIQKEVVTKEETTFNQVSGPWVETENCTSCNECVDKYPKLFKYNKDKQAYIDDPSKGTFEELVKAAEKCPAGCIHPGAPLNSKEPNLDKLIKRAEKFN